MKSMGLVTVLTFHNPSADLFLDCVRWLIDNEYMFISVSRLHDILSNRSIPQHPAVCLTVDDGWRRNLSNIIPAINTLRIPICFFISTDPVEEGVFWWRMHSRAEREGLDQAMSIKNLKAIPNCERIRRVREISKPLKVDREAMTKDEVIAISTNPFITIGSHTASHPCLNRCTQDEMLYEITRSTHLLSEWIQRDISFFAYPNGDYKGSESKILADTGYLLAFTTEDTFVVPKSHDPFYLPRICINDSGSLEENICKMTGVWPSFTKLCRLLRNRKTGRKQLTKRIIQVELDSSRNLSPEITAQKGKSRQC